MLALPMFLVLLFSVFLFAFLILECFLHPASYLHPERLCIGVRSFQLLLGYCGHGACYIVLVLVCPYSFLRFVPTLCIRLLVIESNGASTITSPIGGNLTLCGRNYRLLSYVILGDVLRQRDILNSCTFGLI